MAILDGKLIAAWGVTPDDDVTNKVLVLDDGKWNDYNEVPTARSYATAVGYQTMLIIIGGKADIEGKITAVPYTELLNTMHQ